MRSMPDCRTTARLPPLLPNAQEPTKSFRTARRGSARAIRSGADPMPYMTPAQAAAQFASLIVFIAAARWYVAPWLTRQPRAPALIALLWVHVFRYVALQVFAAQHEGFPISRGGAIEIMIGDVGGAALA